MRYTVLTRENIDDLSKEVRIATAYGWELQGGVSMAQTLAGPPIRWRWAQAMILTDEEEDARYEPGEPTMGELT
jgi:hypothetical protein